MRRPVPVPVLLFAACWLAAGPGGVTVQAALACRHQHLQHPAHGGHSQAPAGRACFCDEMTGGSVALLSPAAPVPVAVVLPVVLPARVPPAAARPPLPPSPAFPPTPPPPDGLA